MYLFFDTETTGTPKNYKASFKDIDNWPRVTQLAYQVYDENFNCIFSYSSLIKPNGWTIPTVEELTASGSKDPNFFVNNNMSTERCEKEGLELSHVLFEFIDWIEKSRYVLAHNLNFDLAVISCEIFREKLEVKNKPIKICTMQSTTDILQLPGTYGFKWPTLTELHNYLFGCDFDKAHDALNDVEATAKCFFELVKRKLIQLQ